MTIKLYSQIIGLPIIWRSNHQKLARVFHLVLDPNTGTLIAVLTTHGVIAPVDLLPFQGTYLEVSHKDVFIEEQDLARLNKIEKKKWIIIGKKVQDTTGNYLGRVANYTLDMDNLILKKIFVTKKIWRIYPIKKQFFDREDIIKITKSEIIVKNKNTLHKNPLEDYFKIKYAPPQPGRAMSLQAYPATNKPENLDN